MVGTLSSLTINRKYWMISTDAISPEPALTLGRVGQSFVVDAEEADAAVGVSLLLHQIPPQLFSPLEDRVMHVK